MNTPEVTADVTHGRQGYIGASEAHHVLDLPPYGCRRKCALEKLGIGYDPGEVAINPKMDERGHTLEPIVADVLEKDTGVEMWEATEFHGKHKDAHPWLVAHPDRVVDIPFGDEWGQWKERLNVGPNCPETTNQSGLAQLKTSGDAAFRKMKKDGIPPYMLAQVQHEMLAVDAPWNILFALQPDSFERIGWIVGADAEFHDAYLKAGDALWRTIENARGKLSAADSPDLWDEHLPAALPAKSVQCKKCPFRKSCQGEKLLAILNLPAAGDIVKMESPEWAAAMRDWLELTEVAKDVATAKDAAKAILEAIIGDDTVAEGGGGRLYFNPLPGNVSPDGKRMAAGLLALAGEIANGTTHSDATLPAELRRIAAMTKVSKPSRPFKIFPK